MAASDGHPSVERIYDRVRSQFPTTSIATIYKAVALLKQENEVIEISFPDGSNRYDGKKPYPHPRLICTRCRKIIDPDLSSLEDLAEEVPRKPVSRSTLTGLISSAFARSASSGARPFFCPVSDNDYLRIEHRTPQLRIQLVVSSKVLCINFHALWVRDGASRDGVQEGHKPDVRVHLDSKPPSIAAP